MKNEAKRDNILSAAVAVATRDGFHAMTRDNVALQANISMGAVNYYFDNMTKLRRAVMRSAINRELVNIVAAGLSCGDKDAQQAPDWLKRKAVETFLTEV